MVLGALTVGVVLVLYVHICIILWLWELIYSRHDGGENIIGNTKRRNNGTPMAVLGGLKQVERRPDIMRGIGGEDMKGMETLANGLIAVL